MARWSIDRIIKELDVVKQTIVQITSSTSATSADAVSVTPSGNLSSTDVQSALEELQGDIDGFVGGTGDMQKATYDTDNDGIVDNAEQLNSQTGSYYLDRTNHSGSQAASTISDFDTEVSNNTDVAANTSARHTHANQTTLDNITAAYTTEEQTKLSGIAAGAEVNVNADWDAVAGDAVILNKPTVITLADVYPIGSIYISVVSTNPNTLFGFGTWSAFGEGKTLVGLDSGQTEFDTVEETGGSKTHTLTIDEMPTHTHTQDAHTHTITDTGHTHGQSIRNTGTAGTNGSQGASNTNNATAGTTASGTTGISINNATATNQNAGGGQAHNNLQPYIVVYMWKRTA